MKTKWLKILGVAVLGTFAAAGSAVGYLYVARPAMAPPLPGKVLMTQARIERGKYLFNLADCDGCHSERDFSRFGGPVVESGRGKGTVFPPELGLPGTIAPPNITPDKETGIGSWTDGEKIRAIREGIGRDGRVLFPMMPYRFFRKMSDEDVQSLVAYLNTLPPIRNAVPRSRVDFPVSLLIRSEPQPAGAVPPPDRTNRLEYGEYLVNLVGCAGCHTSDNKMPFAGGTKFTLPPGTVVSANITPHPETGIGKWTEEYFLDRFYQYKEYAEKGPPSVGPEGFTLMPWLNLSQLPPDDLKAIYTFLRSQAAFYNAVETHPTTVAENPGQEPRS
jgi:mono/diheme cytochrome c family protein